MRSASDDLVAATIAREREFWVCWRRFNWVFGRPCTRNCRSQVL